MVSPARMALLLVCFLFCSLSAVVTSGPAGNSHTRNEIQPDEIHAFIRHLGQMIGYPQIFINKQSDDLFSEEEIQKIISYQNLDEKLLDAPDYRDPCAHDLIRVALSLKEKWAISMIDADGKLPAGVLAGNRAWAGAYKECLTIQAPADPTDNQKGFGGRYCYLSWTINALKMPLITGFCVPDTCQEVDFYNITKIQLFQKSRKILQQLNMLGDSLSTLVSVTGIFCQEKTVEYSAGAITVLVILFIFLFLVIIGTTLTSIEPFSPLSSSSPEQIDSINTLSTDIKLDDAPSLRRNNGESSELAVNSSVHTQQYLIPQTNGPSVFKHIGNFLKCFCLIKNGAKILDTSDKGGTELRSIHGIRFLSMAWVILGHTYAFAVMSTILGNIVDVLSILDKVSFCMILQGTYSVDSFFVLSGFLLTHLFLREMNARDGKISWLAFYLHRYWRLTPVYVVVMAFNATVTLYLISGPFQPQVLETGCKKSWWWNLLYINNFVSLEEGCMSWSWYLANDMQFYVISPLFLYALWKWPKVGLGIVASLLCTCWISAFAISYHYDIFAGYAALSDTTNVLTYLTQMIIYMNKIYIKPYTRIGAYVIGVFLGYVFYRAKGRKNFLSKKYQAIGWIASTAVGLYMIFGLYHVTLTSVESYLYNAFNRSCFSASLAWVIFACLTGHGEPVNKLLSHPIFIPLGRLTYCAYLIHPILMTVYYFSLPTNLILTHFQMVLLFFGFLLATYGISFATTLMLESPTMAIERLFRSGGATKRREEPSRT